MAEARQAEPETPERIGREQTLASLDGMPGRCANTSGGESADRLAGFRRKRRCADQPSSAIVNKGGSYTMTRQNQTNPDTSRPELTPQQAAAVDLLAVGRTITEVAEAVGVTRQTVSGWLNQDPVFEAAVNRRRQELWENVSDRLRALLPNALDVLKQALENGSVKAAVEVLKAAGLHGLQRPSGPVDPLDS
jgi:Homeodomain-like domain